MHLLLCILVAYAFFTYMPDVVTIVVVSVGLVVSCYLILWVNSKRPRKSYDTPPRRLSFVLGLCCLVAWKITGEDFWGVWGRLAIACIVVNGVYGDVYRVIDRAKTGRAPDQPR